MEDIGRLPRGGGGRSFGGGSSRGFRRGGGRIFRPSRGRSAFFRPVRFHRWRFPWWYDGTYYYPWWFAYQNGMMDQLTYDRYVALYGAPPSSGWGNGAVAPPDGSPGYTTVPTNMAVPTVSCDVCGVIGANIPVCSGCYDTFYCSTKCQLKDHDVHKIECHDNEDDE